MAQGSHVPKFGNWDTENVPYTTYFENARKEKGAGVKMNPNDPEENPDAFMFIRGHHESDEVHHVVRPPSSRATSNKTMPHTVKHQIEEEGHTWDNNVHRRNNLDQHKSRGRNSIISKSSSDKSGSDHSLLQPKHNRTRSNQKKSLPEGSSSFSPSPPGPTRVRSGNCPVDDIPQRVASVPKFGAWDETDPKSGEGFTIIFNKVKEEKQIGAAKLSAVPPQPTIYSNGQRNNKSSSSKSKICCCLF